jgi:hypothetical protein
MSLAMFQKTRQLAANTPLRDTSLRARDATSRMLADITASRMFSSWGQRLLLRTADRELRRMKRRGGKTVRNEENGRVSV